MKKAIFLSLLFVLVAGFAPHGFAADPQGFVPLAEIQGLTSSDVTSVVNTQGFANFFNNLYRFLIGIAAVLAVIVIIWEGIQYATQDIPGVKQNAKDRIMQAIFGLILVLSPVLVFSIINPSILNLSLNMERLDTFFESPSTGNTQMVTSDVRKNTSGHYLVTTALFFRDKPSVNTAVVELQRNCENSPSCYQSVLSLEQTGCVKDANNKCTDEYFRIAYTINYSDEPYRFISGGKFRFVPDDETKAFTQDATCRSDGGVSCVPKTERRQEASCGSEVSPDVKCESSKLICVPPEMESGLCRAARILR